MYVTYADLFQLLMLIVALVSLCYKIFKDKQRMPRFASHPYVKENSRCY